MTTQLAELKHLEGNSIRARVQRFGGNLAGMIMPNIGAFIAWGLITALFIPTGWLPNAKLAELVNPMITFLLPVLIGYTGGRLVHGQRGAVVGAIATIGVVVGTDSPMFLGAMIIGPLTAFLLKLVDGWLAGKIRTGFEMLVNNFSAGILGGAMALGGLAGIGPVVGWLTRVAGNGVDVLIDSGVLPLVSIIVEPAKVLFLNNAINHGVLSPLAVSEAADAGKSVLFMIETNPGPGLGILIAYLLFGPRTLRASVPGAMIIHFLGGIHEIYFPYVLMKPRLILAAMAGGAAGVGTAVITNAGLVATPSPGSIFAYLAVTPRGGYFGVLAAIVVATGVSFVVAALLLGFGKERKPVAETATAEAPKPDLAGKRITSLVVACDAGMGSSVMLAAQLTKRLAPYGVTVVHTSINEIPSDATLVLTHADLAGRARAVVPAATVVEFRSYLGDPVFDDVEAAIRDGVEIRG
jgi:PTS system mannitol-specific IIC component